MSHLEAGAEAMRRSVSPGSLKRKRDSPSHSHSHEPSKALKASRAAASSLHPSAPDAHAAKHYRSPDSDEMHHSDSGEGLRDVGSASSLTSSASTVFSGASHSLANGKKATGSNGLTPLTVHEESSSPKGKTPPVGPSLTISNGSAEVSSASATYVSAGSRSATQARPRMLPPTGKAKGYRVVWDPELDGKLSKEERKRATPRRREFGTEVYEPDPPPDPRLAIPGYMSGNCRAKNQPSKAILRLAPYNLPQYRQIDKHSVGPGEAQQIVVSGFDPFLPENTLRLNFSSYGSIGSIDNKTDPETGSFLGVALIRYRDSPESGAVQAAKRAGIELHGHRIGLHTIRVELDREGRKCRKLVEHVLKRVREERVREMGAGAPPPPPPPPDVARPTTDSPAPPLNAPRGPSGKSSTKIPEGPKSLAPVTNVKSTVVGAIEGDLVLSKIKRKPYLYIPHTSVPVLATTIPHLKKRLKSYDWREVRLDRTGYYIIFDDSKRGEDETERCFTECNKALLFTYNMEMECQKYGNPNYERSPSPERAMAQKHRREQYERLMREQDEDLEIEKKGRAENLDPVLGALEQLRLELLDRIMGDIKTRIAIPVFHDGLDPVKYAAKRRKLGLPDPSDIENKAPGLLYNKIGDPSPQHARSRFGHALSLSKPLRPHDRNAQRGKKGERERGSANAFVDERRRRPAHKSAHARGLHFRLQQMYDEEDDSDDERQTSVTRDTEEQESRPLSRASRTSTPFDSESVAETPKHKRRKIADWEEEEKETFDALQKQLIGHLLHKEPEDLATRELELVINTLPRSSKYSTRARTELYIRQRSKADDDLFQVKSDGRKGSVDDLIDDSELLPKAVESPRPAEMVPKVVKEKAKKKTQRKSKEQILEEQEALKAEAEENAAKKHSIVEETVEKIEQTKAEVEATEEDEDEDENDEPTDVHLRFTHDKPRRTVEDDDDLVLDIDGWQDVIKDDEDLMFAKWALTEEAFHELGDIRLWSWKQKEIKALNSDIRGPVRTETSIEGYYVANPSGSARTEGVKKILNEEKSKYLPHRIKVQKAREERQAQAKANPTAAAEAAKIAAAEKIASTATSRSNRVNNRRLVNDINLQKQTLATANSDADVAIRFNQLKKRKKLVKFDRSAIHGWGLYAEENIGINELIIEYVGEKVRQKVADMRELKYDKQGVGSSYLFRMMDDEIVDATKKGGIARFINHSCTPNCTAKIIKVEGTPRIVIYALKDIGKNEELTYDYKFEREIGSTDRIPCLCGSANCKGFLN